MAFVPVGNNRVPFSLTSQLAIRSISTRQRELTDVATELSTGRRLERPSDNPNEALRATVLQRTKEQQLQFRENLRQSTVGLNTAEDVLSSFTDALDRARAVSVEISDGTRSDADYAAARSEVNALIDQLVTAANRQVQDRYLLAGGTRTNPPFVRDGNFIQFTGDRSVLQSLQGIGEVFPTSITADSSIGTFSSAGYGTAISADINGATRLANLNQGQGVDAGSIRINTGSGAPVVVDLSQADSIQDVIDIVNNDPTLFAQSFTIALNAGGNGLSVATGPTANVTIEEVDGGSTARDLGIRFDNAGIPATGSNLSPKITRTTPLALLNGGAGVNTTVPIVIENGPYSATIDLSAAVTVEDVLNTINTADVRVRAEINDDGTGINVLNTLSGASYSIVEGSPTGLAATGLGILTTRLDTPLADFNEQAGVDRRVGEDIEITVGDGTVYRIDLSSAETVADVQSIIQTETAGDVSVTINPQGGIVLNDNTVGANPFAVRNIDDSQAASDLGIESSVAGGGTILGTNNHKARVKGVFDTLIRFRDGIANRDNGEIGVSAQQIDRDLSRLLGARGELGARLQTIDTLDGRISTDLETIETETTRLVDADLSETVTKLALQQTALQAALASSSRLLQNSLLDYL